jgi:hypothetical protein
MCRDMSAAILSVPSVAPTSIRSRHDPVPGSEEGARPLGCGAVWLRSLRTPMIGVERRIDSDFPKSGRTPDRRLDIDSCPSKYFSGRMFGALPGRMASAFLDLFCLDLQLSRKPVR